MIQLMKFDTGQTKRMVQLNGENDEKVVLEALKFQLISIFNNITLLLAGYKRYMTNLTEGNLSIIDLHIRLGISLRAALWPDTRPGLITSLVPYN